MTASSSGLQASGEGSKTPYFNPDMGRPVGSEHILTVSPGVADRMWGAAEDAAGDLAPWVDANPLQQIRRVRDLLRRTSTILEEIPPDIVTAGRRFRKEGNEYGAMLIRGLAPPDDVMAIKPNTPEFPDNVPAARKLALMALAVTGVFGAPISYDTYPKKFSGAAGQFVKSVAPTGEEEGSVSSNTAVNWHTEVLGSLYRPDLIALFGLRGQPDAFTAVLPAPAVIAALDDRDLAVLSQPRFYLKDGLVPHGEDQPHPIVSEIEGRPALALSWIASDIGPFSSNDPDAARAWRNLLEVLRYPPTPTVHSLDNGELFCVDNRGPHARTGFEGSFRWMLRTFVGGERHFGLRFPDWPVIDPTIHQRTNEQAYESAPTAGVSLHRIPPSDSPAVRSEIDSGQQDRPSLKVGPDMRQAINRLQELSKHFSDSRQIDPDYMERFYLELGDLPPAVTAYFVKLADTALAAVNDPGLPREITISQLPHPRPPDDVFEGGDLDYLRDMDTAISLIHKALGVPYEPQNEIWQETQRDVGAVQSIEAITSSGVRIRRTWSLEEVDVLRWNPMWSEAKVTEVHRISFLGVGVEEAKIRGRN